MFDTVNGKVAVSVTRTLNDGNYGSYKIGLSYEGDLEDGADVDDVYDQMYGYLVEKLEKKLDEMERDL